MVLKNENEKQNKTKIVLYIMLLLNERKKALCFTNKLSFVWNKCILQSQVK